MLVNDLFRRIFQIFKVKKNPQLITILHIDFVIPEQSFSSHLSLSIEGSFRQVSAVSSGQKFLSITVESFAQNHTTVLVSPDVWKIPIVNGDLIDVVAPVIKRKMFDVDSLMKIDSGLLRLKFQTNSNVGFALKLGYDVWAVNMNVGVLCAMSVLILLYLLIIFEVI